MPFFFFFSFLPYSFQSSYLQIWSNIWEKYQLHRHHRLPLSMQLTTAYAIREHSRKRANDLCSNTHIYYACPLIMGQILWNNLVGLWLPF
jgi:hypothetical protein